MNFDDDKKIDIIAEREKFEDIVEDFSLKNFGWYIASKYVEYKTNSEWFEYS